MIVSSVSEWEMMLFWMQNTLSGTSLDENPIIFLMRVLGIVSPLKFNNIS